MKSVRSGLLRVFVEVDTTKQADKLARQLVKILQPCIEVHQRTTQKYWKIPEYYQIKLEFNPAMQEEPREALYELLLRLGFGWTITEFREALEAIWNKNENTCFALNEARWAHLQLFDADLPQAKTSEIPSSP